MQKEEIYLKLFDVIETSHDITCTNCRKVKSVFQCDEYDACEQFSKKGWRRTRENVYCPDCAKKKLKK